ncbi:MAG: M48 family metallopeptidase [Kiritimatiellae bacterium]|nr:M48 family metallopeptidase [Kiritimatiellia bacterium]
MFLTFFFIAAVVLIILAVYTALAFLFLNKPPAADTDLFASIKRLWNPVLFAGTAGGTLLVILTGTLYKISALSTGGEAVARMFGAKPVNPQTSAPAERRLLNVVEEMAIASGLPAPRVYLLDEDSINAFAAGFSPRDAIIGVTRGCMNLLTRDELQGVIAHEFSHVLNGDMRLNLRLMGVLHGLLLISLIGWWIFRISARPSGASFGGSTRKKGGNTAGLLLAGLCLMIIGYIGVLFGRLIKSAVSRQREFLADAAAVQFTRNPGGIAGALKKIGGFASGGRISHPNAEEASHLFFADGLNRALFTLMSTHPPLPERIRRIDPSFDGKFSAALSSTAAVMEDEAAPVSALAAKPAAAGRPAARAIRLDPDKTSEMVGRMDAEILQQTSRWLALLPPAIRAAAHDPAGAQALITAVLLSRDNAIRASQLHYLENNADKKIHEKMLALMPDVQKTPPESFLALSDLAMTAIRTLPRDELADFTARLRYLTESDGTITLFEYMIQARAAGQIRNWRQKTGYNFHAFDFHHHLPAMVVVLSTFAYYGHGGDDRAAEQSFREGMRKIPRAEKTQILPKDQCGLQQVDRALAGLSAASPRIRKHFIDACCACVAHDNLVNASEAELLRAAAAILDCPIPPFLPSDLTSSANTRL